MAHFPEKKTEIIKVVLPSTAALEGDARGWVELEVGKFLTGDIMDMNTADTTSEARAGAAMLLSRIRDWNFEDDNGVKWPINLENICKLDLEDYGYLGQLAKGETPSGLPKAPAQPLQNT